MEQNLRESKTTKIFLKFEISVSRPLLSPDNWICFLNSIEKKLEIQEIEKKRKKRRRILLQHI